MKKLIDKLRRFIIKKLGGYTAQYRIDGEIPKATYNNCSFEVHLKRGE